VTVFEQMGRLLEEEEYKDVRTLLLSFPISNAVFVNDVKMKINHIKKQMGRLSTKRQDFRTNVRIFEQTSGFSNKRSRARGY
jgi:hypothetical protein